MKKMVKLDYMSQNIWRLQIDNNLKKGIFIIIIQIINEEHLTYKR